MFKIGEQFLLPNVKIPQLGALVEKSKAAYRTLGTVIYLDIDVNINRNVYRICSIIEISYRKIRQVAPVTFVSFKHIFSSRNTPEYIWTFVVHTEFEYTTTRSHIAHHKFYLLTYIHE